MLYKKIGGNENYPDDLNAMVNYHHYGENRVITRKFPSMLKEMVCFLHLCLAEGAYICLPVAHNVHQFFCPTGFTDVFDCPKLEGDQEVV